MCTSLLYFDAANHAYLGQTLEFAINEDFQVAFVPQGEDFSSSVEGFATLQWRSSQAYLGIAMPSSLPEPGKPFEAKAMSVIGGINQAGLTFSLQAYPQAGGQDPVADAHVAMLRAADLGAWALGQFTTVAEVKQALETQAVFLTALAPLGGLKTPFHYSLHDASGASIVIEFHQGVRTVYDNPVGVMTNAPQFAWHLTNLNNYTFLSNVDHSKATFGQYEAEQPGAGIAKAGLPSSDTSVARFVRAAFYAQYAEKQDTPDKAVQMVAHIMNNFDRPRGIAVDPPNEGSSHMHLQGQALDAVPTEFTCWTSITDLSRKRLYVRDTGGMNYVSIDLEQLAKTVRAPRVMALAVLAPQPADLTAAFA